MPENLFLLPRLLITAFLIPQQQTLELKDCKWVGVLATAIPIFRGLVVAFLNPTPQIRFFLPHSLLHSTSPLFTPSLCDQGTSPSLTVSVSSPSPLPTIAIPSSRDLPPHSSSDKYSKVCICLCSAVASVIPTVVVSFYFGSIGTLMLHFCYSFVMMLSSWFILT